MLAPDSIPARRESPLSEEFIPSVIITINELILFFCRIQGKFWSSGYTLREGRAGNPDLDSDHGRGGDWIMSESTEPSRGGSEAR